MNYLPTCIIDLIYEFSACNVNGCREHGYHIYQADAGDLSMNENLDAYNGYYCDEHIEELEKFIDYNFYEAQDYGEEDYYVEDWDY